jgi:uncharacterized damage-inducible protein DinB
MRGEREMPEPWLQGTWQDVGAVQRAVLHALELARDDLRSWCEQLTDAELNLSPATAVNPVAFHLRHIARSIDRLLTYAEGGELTPAQLEALRSEHETGATKTQLFAELRRTLLQAATRIRAFDPSQLEAQRTVGAQKLPTSLGGLLVHVADHTQRHVGQAITTAKVAIAQRSTATAGDS